jgi:hypothetical protein
MDTSLSTVFLYELLGTATLLLLGCGVVANVALAKSKGEGGGFLLVNFGWGIAVFAGVYVGWKSARTSTRPSRSGLLASGADTYAEGVDVTFATTLTYIAPARRRLPRRRAGLAGLQEPLRRDGQSGGAARRLLHRARDPQPGVERRDGGDRHVRAGLRHPAVRQHPE